MDQELRKRISVFRFGLISPLVSRKGMSRGEQEALLRDIIDKSWEIPGSSRSQVARSTVLRWVALYWFNWSLWVAPAALAGTDVASLARPGGLVHRIIKAGGGG